MTTQFKRAMRKACPVLLVALALATSADAHVDAGRRAAVLAPAAGSAGLIAAAGPMRADAARGSMRVGLTVVAAETAATPEAPLPAPAELDYPATPNAVLCDSDDRGYRECRTPFRGPVQLSRQTSATRCIRDANWGWRDGAVWVDSGCGAVFVREGAEG